MRYLETKISNLTNLRTSLITAVIVLSGGIMSLIYFDIPFKYKIVSLLLGIYFDLLFIDNIISINKTINKTLEELKNESK